MKRKKRGRGDLGEQGRTMHNRKMHNLGEIKAFLNRYYPDSAPGSPDPEQTFDDNKKGSRVIMKSGAYRRVDSRYADRHEQNHSDPAINESFVRLLRLFEKRSFDLSDDHGMATRFVLLNVNSAGGYKELERLEDLQDPDARQIAAMCREVIRMVLLVLEEQNYWLNVGPDETYRSKVQEAAVKREEEKRIGIMEAYRKIVDYFDARLKAVGDIGTAEYETAERFDCSTRKVRNARAAVRYKRGDIAS
jgi:hypothetical protein